MDVWRGLAAKAILDTHVLFGWMKYDSRLDLRHRTSIEADANDMFVSAITGWEVALKVKIGKSPEAAALLAGLATRIVAASFAILPLTMAQAQCAGGLDLFHRDPFDRLLAAQALDRDLPILTVEPAIAKLGCRVI